MKPTNHQAPPTRKRKTKTKEQKNKGEGVWGTHKKQIQFQEAEEKSSIQYYLQTDII